jgi:uncharacterized RDD family membrane protein YckC
VVKTGRYGPYVSHDRVNATLTSDMSPDTVSLEQAVELLRAKSPRSSKATRAALASKPRSTARKPNPSQRPAVKSSPAVRNESKPPRKVKVPTPDAPPPASPPPSISTPGGPFDGAQDRPSPSVAYASAIPSAEEPLYAAVATGPAEGTAGGAATELVLLPRAAFVERLAAFALDAILIAIIVNVLDIHHQEARVGFLVALAYHVSFWTLKGTTLGGIICQLRLVRTDGTQVGFPDALVRGLTGIFSLAVLGIGFLWILKDPDRQAWHDRVAGTFVVKVPRSWPI